MSSGATWCAGRRASATARWRLRGRPCRGGVPVAKETGRAHAEPQGPAREAAQQAARPQVERPRASAAPVAAAPGPRLVETAGVMLRTRETGWPAVPIGLVAGWVAGALG